ncbi:MAG: OsmC family protein [Bacillota bacterium]|nr:OsmC family protein [Bacillota bacterium]
MAKQTFSAVTEIVQGLQVSCRSRSFEMIIDEPEGLGGSDTGMSPVEALLNALGACKCIVVQSFAPKFRIRLKSVRVEVEGVLDPAGFMGRDPEAKIGFSEIRSHFHIDADNTPDEIARFVDFVEARCPVQDTLTNPAICSHVIH